MLYSFISVLTCIITVVLLYFSTDVLNCCRIDVLNYCRKDAMINFIIETLKQIRKSVIDWWFASLNQYLFTSLKIYINE